MCLEGGKRLGQEEAASTARGLKGGVRLSLARRAPVISDNTKLLITTIFILAILTAGITAAFSSQNHLQTTIFITVFPLPPSPSSLTTLITAILTVGRLR